MVADPPYKDCRHLYKDGDYSTCKECDEVYCPKYEKVHTESLNVPSVDSVNRPAHYTDGKIEVIDYIEDKGLGFCLGNAIKYISRAGKKYKDKEVEDLRKAIWYIERRIKELEELT